MYNKDLAELLESLAEYADEFAHEHDFMPAARHSAIARDEAHRLREANYEEGMRATKAATALASAFSGIGAGRKVNRDSGKENK